MNNGERVHKVLIVDDEPDLVKGLALNFKREGYEVFTATDGATALKLAAEENPHLVLLDVVMPGLSGLDVCREMRRKEADTRIVMMSAKSEDIDRIVGLEVGADDYLSKPFNLRELQAVVRARLRYRAHAACAAVSKYSYDEIELDFEKLIARKKGKSVDLTPREFDIMHYLVRFRGQVVTRDQILEKLWGHDTYVTPRTVDNHVLRLRRKLEHNPARPQYILSVYGGGYKFVG